MDIQLLTRKAERTKTIYQPGELVERRQVTIENIDFERIEVENGTVFYLTEGIAVPAEIIHKIAKQEYTDEDVARWMTSDVLEPGLDLYPAIDEVKTLILSMLHGDSIERALDLNTVDKVSGIDLYQNNPIGHYYQQGDVLIFQEGEDPETNGTPATVRFDDLCSDMILRLRANVFYELVKGEVKLRSNTLPVTFLKMGNASWYNERAKVHLELVDNECNTILDAIEFRNGTRLLPCKLS